MDTNTPLTRALLQRTVAWDNHACVPLADEARTLAALRRYHAAGFSLIHVNVGDSDIPIAETVRQLAFARRTIRAHPDEFALVSSVADIAEVKRQGKLAICFDLEGAHGLESNLEFVSLLYDLGVRWMLVAYNRRNQVGGGCHDAHDEGLSEFGHRWVAEMEAVGMIVDVAHTGYRTALEVCAIARRPVNISHSNPLAVRNHPRCVPDALMQACAATGGVLGISGVGIFLGDNDASTDAVMRSIDRAVEVMGVDHVGLGLDFVFDTADMDALLASRANIWPVEFGYRPGIKFVEPERLGAIIDQLLARGYSEADVAKLAGGNFLRVAAEVWR
jgi:membrane dipeptidase